MRRRLTVGPGAASMVLILVVLSMSVLGMLTLIGARNADQLSERAARVVEENAALDAQAERTLSAVDALLADCAQRAENDEEYLAQVAAALPEGMALKERRIVWREQGEGREMECAVEIAPWGEEARARWRVHRLAVYMEEAWN